MKKNLSKINSGFTLIEILLYVSLFVLITLGSIMFIHTMIETNVKTKIILEADSESERVLSLITQYIRNSQGVLSPAKESESDTLILQTFEESNPVVIFGLDSDSIVIVENIEATTTITSNKIIVSNLMFKNLGRVNGKDSIKVSFTIRTNRENDRQEYSYEKSYNIVASLRN